MKKVLAVLLVFSFAFSVSAATVVQSKIPDKAKIEKPILNVDSVFVVSHECEQIKVTTKVEEPKEFPSPIKQNYNFKEIRAANFSADISRKRTYIFPIIT